jgi:hypothetical protein
MLCTFSLPKGALAVCTPGDNTSQKPPPYRLDIIFDIELVLAFLAFKWNYLPIA